MRGQFTTAAWLIQITSDSMCVSSSPTASISIYVTLTHALVER